jgi:PAS domain S-box-containing protein
MGILPLVFRHDERPALVIHTSLILVALISEELLQYGLWYEHELSERLLRGKAFLNLALTSLLMLGITLYYSTLTGKYARQLAASEQRFKLAAEGSQGGVFDWHIPEQKLTCSNRLARMVSLDPGQEELAYYLFYQIVHKDDREVFHQALTAHFMDGQQFECEFRFAKPAADGQDIWVRMSGQTIFQNTKPLRMCGIINDISEIINQKKQIEQDRLKALNSAKLASLGEMASGIAHEVNNPLAIIQGYIERIEVQLEKTGPLNKEELLTFAARAKLNIKRISKIVYGMSMLARDGSLDPFEMRSVKSIIDDILELTQTQAEKRGIEIKVEDIDPLVNIQCRTVEIGQVLLNLLNNAIDALEDNSQPLIRIAMVKTEEWVDIIVEDNGPGVPDHLHEKIIEPFFTTKLVGKGTGLGLSISSNIALHHHGKLMLENLHPGTRFVLRLPNVSALAVRSADRRA